MNKGEISVFEFMFVPRFKITIQLVQKQDLRVCSQRSFFFVPAINRI
jgi:hypothetical protein